MNVSRIWICCAVVSVCACKGSLGTAVDVGLVGDPDDGSVDMGRMDATEEVDMPAADMEPEPEPDPLCVAVTCLPNSSCYGGVCHCDPGFMGDPSTGCTVGDPCMGVNCAFGATCRDDGMCSCDPGFDADDLGGCVFQDPGFPDERTQLDVCARWTQDYPERAVQQWQTLPVDACDSGALEPDYQLDGIRRVSLYRWLAALPAVTSHPGYAEETQACATALEAEGIGVRPVIETSFECYSDEAAAGAMGSNIARGPMSPGAAVDYFMEDADVESLGRRRWILNPSMGATAFGQRGSYACMYAVDDSGSGNPLYVAYPNGTFPREALLGPWTFSSGILGLGSATVAITDAVGSNVAVENVRVPEGNFGDPTLAFDVPSAAAGQTYTVTVSNLLGEETEVVYTVNVVACE